MTEDIGNMGEPDETKKGGGLKATLITAGAGVLVAVIGLIGAGVQAHLSSSKDPGPMPEVPTVTTTLTFTPSPPPPVRVDRAISTPEENAGVPLCADVKGSSVDPLPQGKTLVVAVQEDEDTRIYFEQAVRFLGKGQWAAQVNLGDQEKPRDAVGHHFSIYAVAMDDTLAKYLAGTNPEEGNTWWSNTAWPAGSDPGEATRVVRSAAVGSC